MAADRFSFLLKLFENEPDRWEDILLSSIPYADLHNRASVTLTHDSDTGIQSSHIYEHSCDRLLNQGYTEDTVHLLSCRMCTLIRAQLPGDVEFSQNIAPVIRSILDRWLGRSSNDEQLIFSNLNSSLCDWLGEELSLSKSWHAAYLLAIVYLRLLMASLYLGEPPDEIDPLEPTIDQLISFMMRRCEEAFAYAEAKSAAAGFGAKSSRPKETRWEKIVKSLLQEFSSRKINEFRFKSGAKKGRVSLEGLAKHLEALVKADNMGKLHESLSFKTIAQRLPDILQELKIPLVWKNSDR